VADDDDAGAGLDRRCEVRAHAVRELHGAARTALLGRKHCARALRNVEPNNVVDLMNRIPKNERADVLREVERTDPKEIRWLRAVCRDSNDPAMKQAFKDYGR